MSRRISGQSGHFHDLRGINAGSAPMSTAQISREMFAGTYSQVDPAEANLIQRVLSGQEEAFRELVRPYEHALFMTTQAILKNEADAEDAAQDAVLKAFTNLARFRGDSKFSTWLIRIATNESLMKLRKDRHQKLHDPLDQQPKDEEGNYIPREFADWREIPSEALQKKELRQALAAALASLTPKHREVFVLRDVQHFSIAETAELLGIRKGAVKTRLMRARLHMRDALAPWYRWEFERWPKEIPTGETMVIEISCEEVWREVSNYLEGEISAELRERMDVHFKGCKHCTAVLDGTRNVVRLVGNADAFELPAGLSDRLYQKLDRKLSERRQLQKEGSP
jgi:RNA polymerase sigma-70 factor, ECF subfamily